MTGLRAAFAVCAVLTSVLIGCERTAPPPTTSTPPPPSPAPAAPAPAPTPAPAQASSAAAPKRAPVLTVTEREFQVALREVTYSGRFPFGSGANMDYQQRGGPAISMQLSIAMTDTMGSRIYRTRQGLTLTSVIAGNGRELVGPEPLNSKNQSSGMRSEFPSMGEGRNVSMPATFLVPIPLTDAPQSIEKIAGFIEIELVTEESERTVALGAPDEIVEVGPGMKAALKLLATDPESNMVTRASVEIRSEAAAAAGGGSGGSAVVQTVELIDTSGATVATLTKREESMVGAVTRRRYAYEMYNPGERREKMIAGKPVKSLRIRAYTGIEMIKLPFEFGPVDLTLPKP